QAALNGARFVDIDYRFARPVADAAVIGSFHDFVQTPVEIESVLDRACAGPAQIAKVSTHVNTWCDNRRLLDLMSRSWPKPVIVTGMGDVGQITRVIGLARGSFVTYGSSGKAAAPGQLTLHEMMNVYRFKRIGRMTKLLGVLGNPLGHSLSPVIHNRAFEKLNLDFVYLKFPADDVKDFFENARSIGIEGLSVTIPHKVAVSAFLDEQTPQAMEVGAVNTVSSRAGKWIGDNTDVDGVQLALTSAGFDPAGKKVVILGQGGAAKAARTALKGAKEVVLLGRRELDRASRIPCDLLINATPVGSYPMLDASPISGHIPAGIVFDMVYNPPMTRLLRIAADQGKTIIQGTSMFLAQAARQFEIWTGCPAPFEVFEREPS
ncbi:MAG: type I 3-dehydroquinate dehydratase, partial [Phycisphaerales bacterium]|nr:type I 3-dehydroquinate dehydratase [Phycisphaerales bacterium]